MQMTLSCKYLWTYPLHLGKDAANIPAETGKKYYWSLLTREDPRAIMSLPLYIPPKIDVILPKDVCLVKS